jgi:hypothetical protein
VVQLTEHTDSYGTVVGFSDHSVFFVTIQSKEESFTTPLMEQERIVAANMNSPCEARLVVTLMINDLYVLYLYQYSDRLFKEEYLPLYDLKRPLEREKLNFVYDLLETSDKLLVQRKLDCLVFASVMPANSSLWILESTGYPWQRSLPVFNLNNQIVGILANKYDKLTRYPIVISISKLRSMLYEFGFKFQKEEDYSDCYFFTLKDYLDPLHTTCESVKIQNELKIKQAKDEEIRRNAEKERVARELKSMSRIKRRYLRNSKPNLFTQSVLAEYRFLRGPGTINTFWEIGTDFKFLPDKKLSIPFEFKFGGYMQKLDSLELGNVNPYYNLTYFRTSSRTLRCGTGLEFGKVRFVSLKGGVMQNIVSKNYFETFGQRVVQSNPIRMWKYLQLMYGYKKDIVSFSCGLEYFFDLPIEMGILPQPFNQYFVDGFGDSLYANEERWSFNFQLAFRLFGGYGDQYKKASNDTYKKL